MDRDELEQEVICACNDIISEIECRDGQLFDGNLSDALGYVDGLVEALERLNQDDYDDFEELFGDDNDMTGGVESIEKLKELEL